MLLLVGDGSLYVCLCSRAIDEGQIKAAFGVEQDTLANCQRGGLHNFGSICSNQMYFQSLSWSGSRFEDIRTKRAWTFHLRMCSVDDAQCMRWSSRSKRAPALLCSLCCWKVCAALSCVSLCPLNRPRAGATGSGKTALAAVGSPQAGDV